MINWTVSLGYGFQLDVKGALAALTEYDENLDDIDSYVRRDFPLLEIAFGGSMYENNDGYEQWVFIKDSISEIRDWAVTVDPQKMLDSLTPDAMEQLFDFVAQSGCAVGEPQWRMMLCKG